MDPIQTTVNSIFVDNNKLYAGMGDYRICIWDLQDFSFITSIEDDLWEVKSIFICDEFIYGAFLNEQVLIFLIKVHSRKLRV